MSKRLFANQCFACGVFIAGAITVSLFLIGVWLMARQGGKALSLSFLISPMREGGLAGGIVYQTLGTLILVITTAAIVLPGAVGIALLRNVYLPSRAFRKGLTLSLYAANGIPSILYGLFGFWLFVKCLGWGKSWLAGSLVLAIMVMPTVALAVAEGMRRIPDTYLEHARALGLRSSQWVWSVLIPQSLTSLVCGLFLGLARAAGETAPILFTAAIFSGARWPSGVVESPVLALPYHIFTLAQQSYHAQALQNAWGAACVLVALAAGLSIVALFLRARLHEEAV